MIRIWFFGTPSLARQVLEDISVVSDFEVVFVVTNPDKPIGRESLLKSTPVKEYALKKNIPAFTPEKIRGNEHFLNDIRTFWCDYFIVVAYGKILPLELLQIPKKMCINVHGSILPKYRGASPIQSVLLHGERETGVTIMKMSEWMDEGDILKIRSIPIDSSETSETLFTKFSEVSWPTLVDTLRELEMWGITSLPQKSEEASYCKKIEKEDGLIDWSESSEIIYRKWQAYTPWPGVFTYFEGKRLLLEKVSVSCHREERSDPGIQIGFSNQNRIASQARNDATVWQIVELNEGWIGVNCGQWILTLEQLKLEWKKSQSIKDFVNGNQGFISSTL